MGNLEFTPPSNMDTVASKNLAEMLTAIENYAGMDVLVLYGPIISGVDVGIREAVERIEGRREKALFIVDTLGGYVEIVERIVDVVRNRYKEVNFVVPNNAMSAGTVLVLSGDSVFMDSFSRLGPVDPQIPSDSGRMNISGLAYLNQYEEMKGKGDEITQAEQILLQKLDLGELESYRLAKELTVELLQLWLEKFKFKNWKTKETSGKKVTPKDRKDRAKEIAEALNDHERWRSHGRRISSRVLREELNLKIEDLETDPELWSLVREYYWFLVDYCNRNRYRCFIQSRNLI